MKPNQKTFCLITNVHGRTYWSQKLTNEDIESDDTCGIHIRAIRKYGTIYVNRTGFGWFPQDAVEKIHKTVTDDDFPSEEQI